MFSSLKRVVYFGYYIKTTNWSMLRKFMRHNSKPTFLSTLNQLFDLAFSSLRYNISFTEYYQFRFPSQKPKDREKWAGTGTMYEFQLKANPPSSRELLNDKGVFYSSYRQFFRHQVITISEIEKSPERLAVLLKDNSILVCKAATGNCGRQVAFFETAGKDVNQFRDFTAKGNYDLVETFAQQHPALNELSPSAVNTVRIFTRLGDNDEVIVLGCRLRISVNCKVDNLAAGNLAAPIDEQTGIISGPGVYSDITKPDEPIHPITKVPIIGFQLPFWPETLKLAKDAARLHPQNRSIGWDIVVTPDGPGLIEGNHDWCKLVWQMPVKQGLKHLLA